jgi:hypothetical protein
MLCKLRIVIRFMNFMICLKMTWEVNDVNWFISVRKYGHTDFMSRMHKDVHGMKRWTKNPWDAYPWAPCNKTLVLHTPGHYEMKDRWATYPSAPWNKTFGLRTPRHYETKDRWAANPSAPSCDENEWKACIAWWWCVTCFMMIFMTRCTKMYMCLNRIEHIYIS